MDQRDHFKVRLAPLMQRKTKQPSNLSKGYHQTGLQHRKPTIRTRPYKPCRTNEVVRTGDRWCKCKQPATVTNQTPLMHLYGKHLQSRKAKSHQPSTSARQATNNQNSPKMHRTMRKQNKNSAYHLKSRKGHFFGLGNHWCNVLKGQPFASNVKEQAPRT